jgi:hypothetical protein
LSFGQQDPSDKSQVEAIVADACCIGWNGIESGGIDGQLIRPLFSDMTEITPITRGNPHGV